MFGMIMNCLFFTDTLAAAAAEAGAEELEMIASDTHCSSALINERPGMDGCNEGHRQELLLYVILFATTTRIYVQR